MVYSLYILYYKYEIPIYCRKLETHLAPRTNPNVLSIHQQLQGDGYHTSPAHQRTPLVPHDLGEDFNLDFDDDFPIDARRPKNAK